MKNIYKNKYKSGFNIKNNYRIELMINIIKKINPINNNILDIGCYDGTLLSKIPKKNNLFGIEASDKGYRLCLKNKIKVTNFFFNDNKLPYKSNFFDIVIAGEIIEHIYDTDKFLNEIKRILKPNGYLVISTPNIASLPRRLLLFFGINPIIETTPNRSDSSGHIRYFTFKSIGLLLKENGFKIKKSLSDLLNFDNSGKIKSKLIPKIFPTIGQSIILLCEKIR